MFYLPPLLGAAVGAGVGAVLERWAAKLSGDRPVVGSRCLVCAVVVGCWAAAFAASSPPLLGLILPTVLLCILVPAALTDLQTRRIPNLLTGGGLAIVLLVTALIEPHFATERLIFSSAAFTFFLAAALLRPGGIGLGDVKLVAVVGAALGAASVAALAVALVGGALAGVVIAARHGWGQARTATLPLAPFIATSSLAVLLLSG
jgi:leader peptidase (prepilin peptidase) / N-methyltransferase